MCYIFVCCGHFATEVTSFDGKSSGVILKLGGSNCKTRTQSKPFVPNGCPYLRSLFVCFLFFVLDNQELVQYIFFTEN